MVESDFTKNSTAHHHDTYHGNTLPEVGADDSSVHGPTPTHENDEHSQHQEETPEIERNTKMSARSKSTLTNLFVAITFVFTTAVAAAGIEANKFENRFDNNFANRFDSQNWDTRFSNSFEAASLDNRFENFDNSFEAANFENTFQNNFGNRFKAANFDNEYSNIFENSRFDRSLA